MYSFILLKYIYLTLNSKEFERELSIHSLKMILFFQYLGDSMIIYSILIIIKKKTSNLLNKKLENLKILIRNRNVMDWLIKLTKIWFKLKVLFLKEKYHKIKIIHLIKITQRMKLKYSMRYLNQDSLNMMIALKMSTTID